MIHRRLWLPTPRRQPRDPPPELALLGGARIPLAFEVHRERSGAIELVVGSESETALTSWGAAFESAFPGGSLDESDVECPFPAHAFREGLLARSRVARGHHWWPVKLAPSLDYSATLARTLTSPFFQGYEVLLQLLAQPVPQWEEGIHVLASPYEKLVMHLEGRSEPLLSAPTQRVPSTFEKDQHAQVLARRREGAWHVEMRVGITGPEPPKILEALGGWLRQWESINGGSWWTWTCVRNGVLTGKDRVLHFREAFASHDIRAFGEKKEKRNISTAEFASLLPLPWRQEHPGFPYVGSPSVHPPAHQTVAPDAPGRPSLQRGSEQPLPADPRVAFQQYQQRFGRRAAIPLVPPGPTRSAVPPPVPAPAPTPSVYSPARRPRPEPGVIVGTSRGAAVPLPTGWTHLAVLGRTQSGKSTLLLNVVLQLLSREPNATVVILEPTGGLIRDVASRVHEEVLGASVEVDPAHPTFEEDGQTKVSVPLSLMNIPDRESLQTSELHRLSEMVAGDILLSIKNAWGEDSIGGRADFILGGVLRGLLATSGTNLVDAYYVLSDPEVRRRFLQTLPEGPLRNFLRVHLPGLDYAFMFSSLNKVGKIATNPMLAQTLCQRLHPITFEEVLRRRLVLLNLSKGDLGTEASNFLGAILLTQLWAALQRTGSKDHPVYLVVDEFQNYAVPVFQDMLSEGAKFGLHVVAVTQYLHQVPNEIQAALHGNVSAWMFLALGVEDMEAAWKISDAKRFGWVPQDFVNGLEGHQMALAVGGTFAKIQTNPPPPPIRDPAAGLEQVRETSRAFAQVEDSQVSPFQVSQEQLAFVLGALTKGPQTARDLETEVPLLPDRLEVALLRAVQVGDARQVAGVKFELTARGRCHLAAVAAQRNEGEDHTELLAEFGGFVDPVGIAMTIRAIQPTLTAPDGEFEWEGVVYNVEVECSTLATHVPQVVKNVRKAVDAGRKCVIVVPTREMAERLVALFGQSDRSLRLWNQYGLLWMEGSLVPYRVPGTPTWKFVELAAQLASGLAPPPVAAPPTESPSTDEQALPPADPDIARALQVTLILLDQGATIISRRHFLAAVPESERPWWTVKRLGQCYGKNGLDVASSRPMVNGVRETLYDLRTLPVKYRATPFRSGA